MRKDERDVVCRRRKRVKYQATVEMITITPRDAHRKGGKWSRSKEQGWTQKKGKARLSTETEPKRKMRSSTEGIMMRSNPQNQEPPKQKARTESLERNQKNLTDDPNETPQI